MKITKAQAIKLGREFEKLGWMVFDNDHPERVCCGEDRDSDAKFCSDCGKKIKETMVTDEDTIRGIIKAVSKI